MKRQRKVPYKYLEVFKATPKNDKGQIHKSDLTDEEWEAIKGYLPFPRRLGRKRVSDKHAINGILYFLSTAIRWNDMPKYYPSGTTCWSRLKEYDEWGIWDDLIRDLQHKALELGKINLTNSYLDGSPAESKKGLKMK